MMNNSTHISEEFLVSLKLLGLKRGCKFRVMIINVNYN